MGVDREPLLINEDDMEMGGKETIENDFAYRNNVANASIHVRMAFLRKVYSLLGIQLLMSVVISAVCMLSPEVKGFIQSNTWLLNIAFVSTLIILVALVVKRKEHPLNLVLLAVFTIVQSYTIGVVVSFYDHGSVLRALFLTLAVVGGLTGYTMQTKRDFSSMGAGLFAGLCVIMLGGIIQLFVGGNEFELLISISGALLFSLFIIYDTQMLMKNLSPEEYVLATINLYMDIINLFIYILRAMEAARR